MNKIPFFEKARSQNIRFSQEDGRPPEALFFIFFFTVAAFFFILGLRLFQLTVVKGEYFRNLSDENRIREIVIEAPRGQITDRKGYVVAKSEAPNVEANTPRIDSKRIYFEPKAISHLVGYRQLADTQDVSQDNCLYKLKSGDKIGKKGVEKIYDCELRGVSGKKLIEVDALGKFLKTLNVIPPTQGHDVVLALDLDLQKKALELLDGKKGVVVASVPSTGEILALVSSPSYNIQDFEDQNSLNIERYLHDKEQPLFNRVTEGAYAPGSIFKLAIATAALEEKAVTDKTEIEDTGVVTAGGLKFGNWYFLEYGKTEGLINLTKALQRSNDIYFYLAGAKTGEDKIKKWSEVLGYGKKTGIGLTEEVGIIPNPFWKEANLKDRWYTGDTYNLSIGQGYVSTTPIQTLFVTNVFANGGYLCQPQLLKDTAKNCKKLPISGATLASINEGMRQACSTGGTGWPLFDFKAKKDSKEMTIQIACKTGTAESHALSGKPHAWITAYAPFDKPEISLTVLVEEGGQGSDIAGPIARDILKTYFERSQ
jgi:penicillin-binding protein 2